MKTGLLGRIVKYFNSFGKNKGHRPLKREYYDERYRMTLREWLIFHQKEIVFDKASWMGVRVWKNPFDVWIYQEIIYEIKPDVIVEIGSRFGGSTKYFANLLDIMDHGMVVSVDIERSGYDLVHDRVVQCTGDSASQEIVSQVAERCQDKSVLIIHDGDHRRNQVLTDLRNYAPLVSVGSYFIVEDGIVDLFHPEDGFRFNEEGPLVAVEQFLSEFPNFQVDESRERYLLTYNPKGYLKRVA